jgi:DNA-binding SARP family transcriptional activator
LRTQRDGIVTIAVIGPKPLRMPQLEVTLLGAPRITRDGEAVEVDTRKATALLAYLAVTGGRHTRDALCNLLWPEYDGEHARAALRRTLSTLRKALGHERLESAGDSVSLRREDGVQVDVEEFRAGLASQRPERLAAAVDLYRGDFLAGFTLRDSVVWDDWQSFETESLRRELAGALERLAELDAARGDLEAAVVRARRRLALNPLDEPAHRRLIELYARKGERAAAVRQYRECVRILDAALGVPPVEETTRLFHSLQNAGAAAPLAASPAEAAPAHSGLPLVGRDGEWAALVDAYRGVERDGRLVVLEGEMGIGKTRLADDFLASIGEGAVTIAVRCHEDERTLAYAPVAEAMRAALALLGAPPDHAAGELGRLLPEVGPPPPDTLDTEGAQTRFLETLRGVLEAAVAGAAPGVVLFDDVHNADDASLDFVAYVARRLRERPLLLLFTWRSDEVGASHRLRRLLSETTRAGLATAIRPRRLGSGDVEALAAALGGADAMRARAVHRETAGLPLFVVEYLRAVARGEAASPPESVRDLLRARLASLSDLAAQVLTAASVIGGHFDAETARGVGGRTEEETVAALEELAARGIVSEAGDGYDFEHDQLRALAYAETSLARRRLLHGRVGDALARRRSVPGSLAAHTARHYELAGRDAEAAARYGEAGEHARSLYANADAVAYFAAALGLGHPDPGRLHEAVGDLQTLTGDYAAALASYEAAAAQLGPEREAALEHKLGGVHLRRGDWDRAAARLEAGLALVDASDRALRARLLADLSLAAHRRGDGAAAREAARRALADAEAAGDDTALAQAHNILGILAKNAGDHAAARNHLERSLRWADERAAPGPRVAALNNLALLDRLEGDRGAAAERTRAALELCERFGDRHRQAALHNNLADLLHEQGRRDEAMAHLKAAVSIFAEVGESGELQPEIWKLVEW